MNNHPTPTQQFDALLQLEKIEHHHLQTLNPEDKAAFMQLLNQQLETLKGDELESFIEKVAALLDKDTLWDHNHHKIMSTIGQYVKKHGYMPTQSHIAQQCGLTLTTIRRHLKSFERGEAWASHKIAVNLMTPAVTGIVLREALNGNIKAAKLYLDVANTLRPSETIIANQNNYLQINNTVINQHLIQQLRPEQLAQIEQIITTANQADEQNAE